MESHIKWGKTVDAVIIGAGASGMSAALTAHFEGLDVLMIEKTHYVGGSTAISGGAVWLPLNSGSEAAGHPDTYEKVWEYLSLTVGDAAPDHMKRAYLDNGAKMLEYMAARNVLDLVSRTYSPDYYSDLPGASMGGRALDPAAFDGKKLLKHFRQLRDPLKEFMVLGGMMITVADAYHLLGATHSMKSFIYSGKRVVEYWFDRLRGYHRGTRLLLGNALAAQLFYAILKNKIPYWRCAPARQLHQDADGRVRGLTINHNGTDVNIQVRKGIVVATGGFPWSASLREQLYPNPNNLWSMAPAGNQGEGIQLAIQAGAALGQVGAAPAFWAPVSILKKADGEILHYPHLVWDRAKPGLIAVNSAGNRFVNEASSYHEFVTGMYRANESSPSIPAYLLCDHDFIEKWGLGLALPGGRARDHLIKAGYLFRADSLRKLAGQLDIDGSQLIRTVDRYNQLADSGKDTDFGKGSTAYNRYLGAPGHEPNPCLGPLRRAPFYAVKVVAGDIGTAYGIQTDGQARALAANGQPIPGLFVVGNDMQSVMGGAYPGPGITLGPALTFGWVAGQSLAHAG